MSQLLPPALNAASGSSTWRLSAAATESAGRDHGRWSSALKQSLVPAGRDASSSRSEPAADRTTKPPEKPPEKSPADRAKPAAKDSPDASEKTGRSGQAESADLDEGPAEETAEATQEVVVAGEVSPEVGAEQLALAGLMAEPVKAEVRPQQVTMVASQAPAATQGVDAGVPATAPSQGDASDDGQSQGQNPPAFAQTQAMTEAEGENADTQAQLPAGIAGKAGAAPTAGVDATQPAPAGVTGPQAVEPASMRVQEVAGPLAQTVMDEAAQEEMDPNVARVAQGLRGAMNLKGGAVTIRLNPAELGLVRIEMEIHGGSVRAELQSENASVRDLLTHQLGRLRETLLSRGLMVERLEVSPPTSADASHNGQEGQDSAGDGRSRGQFFNQQQSQQQREQAGLDAKARKRFEQLLVDMVG